MSGSQRIGRRSPIEWTVRGVLAAAAAVLGINAVSYSIAAAVRKGDPELAHRLAPHDGQITGTLAQKLLTPKASGSDRAHAEQLARDALLQDPTSVRGAVTLGLATQIRGDAARAQKLLAYSDRLSRRELAVQLWGIESAVARNDIPGALRQYDIALRTSRVAPDLLYPVLGSAAADPAVRVALTRTLAAKPAWSESFFNHASTFTEPRAAAQLFRDLARRGVQIGGEPRARLVNRLIEANLDGEAWSYYLSLRPGADRRQSRDPNFSANLDVPTAFDWAVIDNAGISAAFRQAGDAGLFDYAAPPSIGGKVLQQMQLLPPGVYRLEGNGVGIDQPLDTRPYWLLACRDGRELGRLVMPNSAEGRGAFAGRFLVPAGCPVQILSYVLRPSNSVTGSAGQIDRASLVPARR